MTAITPTPEQTQRAEWDLAISAAPESGSICTTSRKFCGRTPKARSTATKAAAPVLDRSIIRVSTGTPAPAHEVHCA